MDNTIETLIPNLPVPLEGFDLQHEAQIIDTYNTVMRGRVTCGIDARKIRDIIGIEGEYVFETTGAPLVLTEGVDQYGRLGLVAYIDSCDTARAAFDTALKNRF